MLLLSVHRRHSPLINRRRLSLLPLALSFKIVRFASCPIQDDWTPQWSWHGFRYIEVTVPHHMSWGPEEVGAVVCYPMRTDVDLIANISTSDPFLAELRQVRDRAATVDCSLVSGPPAVC